MFLTPDTDRSDDEQWKLYSNEQLWEAFSKDDREAFSAFFLRFYDRLFRYGMNFLSGPKHEAVKDGIQKLFFRLWKKRKSLETPNSIDSYLYVSFRRILLRNNKRIKARNNRNAVYVEEEHSDIFNMEELIILREERKQRNALFREALQTLTPRQKEALLLRIDSGMENKEIAVIMDVSNKRVRNLIYEATKRLKNKVAELIKSNEKLSGQN
ncbi:sigma-70 family RNA polymerase sigma factor [Aliifodinibius salicampi]|uniref:Sigma-70 family RNA polymerase sigma factor n=1 Tax=Fodinibius salicampi TaxID=1920655 RepID=A0ABT3PVN5_9BACT|nr:sigma-70 family RNA polymerase sigma factor [Fodinibius salicampi]MCW9711927.1 sigma-70 family RNA polymerase sigma factor [Fodinibius salicampi]